MKISLASRRSAKISSPFRATAVIPVYNNASYVESQLHSLIVQWRPDIQFLVIDDGSADGSLDVVRETLRLHPHISAKLLRNERTLGLGSLPLLLQHAQGDIIIQCDSDDTSLPGRLDAILSCFDKDRHCRLVTSNATMLSSEGAPTGLYAPDAANDRVFSDPLPWAACAFSPFWLGATSAFRRSLLDAFPPLDFEIFPYGFDLIAALRAVLTGTHHYIAKPLIGYRQHERNTHKLVGTTATDGKKRESFQALELMALAQKIRDVAYIKDTSFNRGRFEPALRQCRDLFFRHFEQWSRLRNTGQGTGKE